MVDKTQNSVLGIPAVPKDASPSVQSYLRALAEAVVGRTGGDVQQALMLLDDAKAMLEAAANKPQMAAEGKELKPIPEGNKGLGKLPEDVRNKMGFMADGGGIMSAEEAMKELEQYRS